MAIKCQIKQKECSLKSVLTVLCFIIFAVFNILYPLIFVLSQAESSE